MMLDSYMRWGLEHPNAYQLVYCDRGPITTPAEPPPEDPELSRQCYDIFAGVVREIAASGRLRSGSGDSAAQAMWMACHGVVALLVSRPHFPFADREELMAVTLDGILNGLVID
jgi:hypothetical protein